MSKPTENEPKWVVVTEQAFQSIPLVDGRRCANFEQLAIGSRAIAYVFFMPEGYLVEVDLTWKKREVVGVFSDFAEAKVVAEAMCALHGVLIYDSNTEPDLR